MELQIGGRSQNSDSFNLRSPFSYKILSEPISKQFKMPAIELFDGFGDPMDHIEGYRALMTLQGASDSLLCIAFLTTLKKATRIWFYGLPQGSISFLSNSKGYLSLILAPTDLIRDI